MNQTSKSDDRNIILINDLRLMIHQTVEHPILQELFNFADYTLKIMYTTAQTIRLQVQLQIL